MALRCYEVMSDFVIYRTAEVNTSTPTIFLDLPFLITSKPSMSVKHYYLTTVESSLVSSNIVKLISSNRLSKLTTLFEKAILNPQHLYLCVSKFYIYLCFGIYLCVSINIIFTCFDKYLCVLINNWVVYL